MNVCELNQSTIRSVANLMAKLKPEFWNLEGAIAQLSSGIGWYIESDGGGAEGWLLCRLYRGYKTVEIETLGYDDDGRFKVGAELQPLVEKCERWANEQGAVNSRFVIGSRGLSLVSRHFSN